MFFHADGITWPTCYCRYLRAVVLWGAYSSYAILRYASCCAYTGYLVLTFCRCRLVGVVFYYLCLRILSIVPENYGLC